MMRKDKDRIFELRKQGRTYREIHRDTGVSRATLSAWFRDVQWSKHLSNEHAKKNRGASKERMGRLNMVRKLKLQYQYALVVSEAQKEYEVHRGDPLFWAGLMLYAGEGDKRSSGLIRISNTDFYIHRIFISFAKKYLKVTSGELRYALLLYPHLDESMCKEEWVKQLSIDPQLFHKTQVIKGKEGVKRLQYGVGMSILSNTALKKKLLKWLSLAENESFKDAGMVQG